jgi:hypothetical protein
MTNTREEIRKLTPEETCAMYHYHNEYARLGIGAIKFYKRLTPREKQYMKDMVEAIYVANKGNK